MPPEDLGPVEWSDGGTSLLGRVFVALHDGPLTPADGEVVVLEEVPIVDLRGWMSTQSMVDDSPVVVPPLLSAWWEARHAAGA